MSESWERQLYVDFFKNGHTNVHNYDRSGKPSLVTDVLVMSN